MTTLRRKKERMVFNDKTMAELEQELKEMGLSLKY